MVQRSMTERQASLGSLSWPVGGSVQERKTPVLEVALHTGLRGGGSCEGTREIRVPRLTCTFLRRKFHSWMWTL